MDDEETLMKLWDKIDLEDRGIIIYKVKNYTLNDGTDKGRQELNNIGDGEGYFVTGGYVIPITWEKKTRSSTLLLWWR